MAAVRAAEALRMKRSSGLPMASSRCTPKICSAARLNSTIRWPPSTVTMASIAESTMASRRAWLWPLRRSARITSRAAMAMPTPTVSMSAISTVPITHRDSLPLAKAKMLANSRAPSAAATAAIAAGLWKALPLTEIKGLRPGTSIVR